MIETDLNKVLNYMKQYVENVYEHDSEPMLTYKDLQLVLEEIERLRLELSGYRQAILQDKEMLGLKQEIEELQEENKMQDHALERLRAELKLEEDNRKYLNEQIEDLHKDRQELIESNVRLREEKLRLKGIIKEVREFINNHFIADDGTICKELEEGRLCEENYSFLDELLEILDKENN